jgi:hypothetical protein
VSLAGGTHKIREISPEILIVHNPKLSHELEGCVWWPVLRWKEYRQKIVVCLRPPATTNSLQKVCDFVKNLGGISISDWCRDGIHIKYANRYHLPVFDVECW